MIEQLGPISDNSLAAIAGDMTRRRTRATATDFSRVDSEIRDGLRNEKARLQNAWKNRLWYEGKIDAFLSAMSHEQNLRMETVRAVNLFECWADLLTKHLYSASPQRTIPDQETATEYLRLTYSKSNFNSVMTLANVYALVANVAAIQVEINQPVDDSETKAFLALQKPAISHRVWPADQFVVWCHPDKPTLPWAVGVIDLFDNQRRLRVWTSEKLVTYATRKFNPDSPWDGTAYYLINEEDNFLGFVPFSFVHWRQPMGEFWSGGPGDMIQMFQEAVTLRLWKMNDDIVNQRPILQARNVRADFAIPKQYQAGTMIKLSPVLDTLGDGPDPSIDYAYCDLGYLSQDWEQLINDMTMFSDSLGIPESAWRLKGQSAASGVAIISEQLPLLDAAKRRQLMLAQAEQDAALVTLYASHTYLGGKTPLGPAIDEFDLTVNWGKMEKSMPGPEYDQHLQFLIVNNLTSEVRAIAATEQITLEQAQEQLDQINAERMAQAKKNAEIAAAANPQPDPGDAVTKGSDS